MAVQVDCMETTPTVLPSMYGHKENSHPFSTITTIFSAPPATPSLHKSPLTIRKTRTNNNTIPIFPSSPGITAATYSLREHLSKDSTYFTSFPKRTSTPKARFHSKEYALKPSSRYDRSILRLGGNQTHQTEGQKSIDIAQAASSTFKDPEAKSITMKRFNTLKDGVKGAKNKMKRSLSNIRTSSKSLPGRNTSLGRYFSFERTREILIARAIEAKGNSNTGHDEPEALGPPAPTHRVIFQPGCTSSSYLSHDELSAWAVSSQTESMPVLKLTVKLDAVPSVVSMMEDVPITATVKICAEVTDSEQVGVFDQVPMAVVVVIDNNDTTTTSSLQYSWAVIDHIVSLLERQGDQIGVFTTADIPGRNAGPQACVVHDLQRPALLFIDERMQRVVEADRTPPRQVRQPSVVMAKALETLKRSDINGVREYHIMPGRRHIIVVTPNPAEYIKTLPELGEVLVHIVASTPEFTHETGLQDKAWFVPMSEDAYHAISKPRPAYVAPACLDIMMHHLRQQTNLGALSQVRIAFDDNAKTPLSCTRGSKIIPTIHAGEIHELDVDMRLLSCPLSPKTTSESSQTPTDLHNDIMERLGGHKEKAFTARVTYQHSHFPGVSHVAEDTLMVTRLAPIGNETHSARPTFPIRSSSLPTKMSLPHTPSRFAGVMEVAPLSLRVGVSPLVRRARARAAACISGQTESGVEMGEIRVMLDESF